MLQSMTGFGIGEVAPKHIGKISVELRSTNHKFSEIVLHLPEGFLSLEEKIKKEIEPQIRRGRVVCAVRIFGTLPLEVFVNHKLAENYAAALRQLKKEFHLKDNLSLDALVRLPGVLCSTEKSVTQAQIWPALKTALGRAVVGLVKMRQKEGKALAGFLKNHALCLAKEIRLAESRFKKTIQEKCRRILTEEERSSFLKNSDITEELDRLSFHVRNLLQKLSQKGPLGKELDFIAQEMQREANTIGAKSCDAVLSGKVIQIKTQIEKIREQVQNIE